MFTNRIRIDGKLTTRSNLHLGSGTTVTRPGLRILEGNRAGTEPEIAAVAVDYDDRPYLPGTSVKGVLRAWLEEHGAAGAIRQLFGFEDKATGAAAGGKAEFLDAFVDPGSNPASENIPYWCKKRLTGVTASVAIDRYTRSASDNRLFHREYVPPGVAFNITITAQDVDAAEIALLLMALRAFNTDDPIILGSDTADGWGQFTWSDETLRVLTPTELPAWLAGNYCGYDGLPQVDAPVTAQTLPGRNQPTLAIGLSIEFSGPFLINDPSRTKTKDDPESPKPNHAPRLDTANQPLLPASALRGVLRARAERIARTLVVKCCDPNSSSACRIELSAGEQAAKAISRLCIPCRLFGAPGWASRIGFSAIKLTNNPRPYSQELVAIDRFTGGVAGSAKFNAEACWQPHFDATLRLSEPLDRAALGLLALALRDLEDGDLTIGFGAAKGYGSCTATVSWPDAADRDAAIAALRALAAPEPESGASEAMHPAPAEMLPTPTPHGDDAFFNPYHFVPSKPGARTTDVSRDDFKSHAVARLGHDRAADGTLSGRILCRLKTETPIVVGGAHVPHSSGYTEVLPFRVPTQESDQQHGEIAIPATTLRGLLSSVAEAASNSALRVLENEHYSYRSATDQSLQAIGEIADGGTKVRPLTPLTAAQSKSYVDGYEEVAGAQPPRLQVTTGSFLSTPGLKSWSADNCTEFWYARLDRKGKVLAPPISPSDWKKTASPGQYTRGILRILGIDDRETEIPTKKTHEIFIPYPDGIEKTPALDAAAAIEEFHKLAKERTVSQKRQLANNASATRNHIALPFSVKGSNRNNGAKDGDDLRLRDGDLVFFQPAADRKTVKRLAVSAIWRERVDGSTFQFFEKIDPELLPFNPERKWLTIAEQMFGFVENKKPKAAGDKKDDSPGLALAGRVRVSFGRLKAGQADVLLKETRLKILSSPKPPSPNLYFRRDRTSGYIAKRDLGHRTHTPQGRKFYLHGDKAANWETQRPAEHEDQKAIVRPIRQGTSFFFHIDFDNLSETELGLLCYALAPFSGFRHKLGMGKPLGLGTVAIEPAAIFLTDRRSRYATDRAPAARYDRKWIGETETPAVWPNQYAVEHGCAADSAIPNDGTPASSWASSFAATMDADIRRALELLGDPRFVTDSVHTPSSGPHMEEKTYEWFGKNDRTARQYLIPLTAQSDSLPPLYVTFNHPFPRVPQRLPIKEPVPPPPPALPPIPPAVNAADTRTLRLRVRIEERRGATFFVVEDPRLETLVRAARPNEGTIVRRLSPRGSEAEVTLVPTVELRWSLGKITLVP
jgi:CRISPR-associated protein (TIGR03986 family)